MSMANGTRVRAVMARRTNDVLEEVKRQATHYGLTVEEMLFKSPFLAGQLYALTMSGLEVLALDD